MTHYDNSTSYGNSTNRTTYDYPTQTKHTFMENIRSIIHQRLYPSSSRALLENRTTITRGMKYKELPQIIPDKYIDFSTWNAIRNSHFYENDYNTFLKINSPTFDSKLYTVYDPKHYH